MFDASELGIFKYHVKGEENDLEVEENISNVKILY